MLHLKRLASAGLTHVHLLPTFHFGGVDDERHKWKDVGKYSILLYLYKFLEIAVSFVGKYAILSLLESTAAYWTC